MCVIIGREEDSSSRNDLLQELTVLQDHYAELSSKLDKLADNDPEVFKMKQVRTRMLREAANRWTDNIFCLQSYGKVCK